MSTSTSTSTENCTRVRVRYEYVLEYYKSGIDDITPVCLKFTFGAKGTNFNCQYLENKQEIDENVT